MTAIRTVGALALAASLGLAFAPAGAADPQRPDLAEVPFILEDTAGDANGVNEQGLHGIVGIVTGDDGQVLPNQSTAPAQVDTADILGARINSLWVEVEGEDELTDYVYTGLEFRIALAAEATDTSAPLLHRFNVVGNGCSLLIQTYSGAQAPTDASVRYSTGCTSGDGLAPEIAEASGEWITHRWDTETSELVMTITADGAPEIVAAMFERGDRINITEIESRGDSVALLVPMWDIIVGAESGKATRFEVGQDIPADEEPEEEPTDGGGTA